MSVTFVAGKSMFYANPHNPVRRSRHHTSTHAP